jgi:uncharacterized protein (TIGR02391 family)
MNWKDYETNGSFANANIDQKRYSIINSMAHYDPLNSAVIERLSKAFGDCFTGSELGAFLHECRIPDMNPAGTKWRRLNEDFLTIQGRDNCSNSILRFIEVAMNPVRYNSHDVFASMQAQVNAALLFEGYEVRDNGKIGKVKKVTTLKEAEERANELKTIFASRHVHPDVLLFCRAELLQENYFHAVLEATKSVADKIRAKTGLTGDGAELIDAAFGVKNPIILLNQLSNETEEAEQKGFANLMKGLFGTFRNPTAHAARIKWAIDKEDALDLFSLVSYAHRRIDSAAIAEKKAK